MKLIFLLLLQIVLCAADFDCIVIGSSPFSLFEALYQSHSGKKVLILEEAPTCGGAWKSIAICGVPHAELGCHKTGNNEALKTFLEEYAGCRIVSMDNPAVPFESHPGKHGWYFSKGCFELIDHLLQLIAATDIVLCTNCKAESVSIDVAQKAATVQTQNQTFTTHKLIVTPMSSIQCGHPPLKRAKHNHLYLLIQDPTPPRFTYQEAPMKGVTRVMNQTDFIGLAGTGRQLIAIQTRNESIDGQTVLDVLKTKDLVDSGAYILQIEPYVYETGTFQTDLTAPGIIEVIQTGHFENLSNYISKWRQGLDNTRHFVYK